jgi:hypothetical protein
MHHVCKGPSGVGYGADEEQCASSNIRNSSHVGFVSGVTHFRRVRNVRVGKETIMFFVMTEIANALGHNMAAGCSARKNNATIAYE